MATTKLQLPTITGNMTADVVRDLNALANAIDAKTAVANGLATLGSDGKVSPEQITAIKDATISQKGIVQLSDSTTSTSKSLAATANAVKAAMDRADQAFTSASDGKSRIATAITGQGVNASSSDSFATLATKISQIYQGKKWATGTATVATSDTTGTTGWVSVLNLGWVPDIFIVRIPNNDSYHQGFAVYVRNSFFDPDIVSRISVSVTGSSTTANSVDFYSYGSLGCQMHTRFPNGTVVNWIAIKA